MVAAIIMMKIKRKICRKGNKRVGTKCRYQEKKFYFENIETQIMFSRSVGCRLLSSLSLFLFLFLFVNRTSWIFYVHNQFSIMIIVTPFTLFVIKFFFYFYILINEFFQIAFVFNTSPPPPPQHKKQMLLLLLLLFSP